MDNLIKPDSKNKKFLENSEEKLLEYIDKKGGYYLNIFKGPKNKINFCALFLGPLWMGYRQMYFESFIMGCLRALLSVLSMLYILFINSWVITESFIKGINYGIFGVMGLFGNYIYFLSLKEKITRGDKKIGVRKIGILYGLFLGILMPLLIDGIFIVITVYFIFK